jgi:hypothetical protein
MKRTVATVAVILALLACSTPALAQVPSPTPGTVKIGFDHDGINTDGYALIVDGTRATVTPTCAGTPRTCTIPFPALTPGTHTFVIAAFNAAGEATSTPVSWVVFVKPGDPTNVRIITGG